MLKLLHIENIAVVERADIEFARGLNILTGETGAGKSIVIDAISAVTGGRVSRDVIRTGSEAASVTAVFSVATDEGYADDRVADSRFAAGWLDENGIEPDESGDVIVARKISADGKNTCRVNGVPVSATQLRDFGAALLDIHGQNDGRKLMDEGAHTSYLDSFGAYADVLDGYRSSYAMLRTKKAEIERLSMDEDEKERRIETLKYQIDDIERAGIKPGEQAELSARREMLLNASRLTEAVETAFESLFGGDSTDGAIALLSEAQNQLDYAARYSEGLRSLGERLTDLRYSAQDISDELRDLRAELDFTPGELDELEARLDILRRITRRYGSEEEAIEHLERGRAELSDIEDSSDLLVKLEGEIEACLAEAKAAADKLSGLRRSAAAALEKRVMEELSQLSMPGARFVVEMEGTRGENGLNGDGRDEVRFIMSANAGESPGRISRIASGGELARIMLALKSVLSGAQETGTMVFDEVDSGVSGIAAQRVGEKLAKLAQHRQVLCVTHLPQIAVMADTHFEIQKSVLEGRTFTSVRELDGEGRKEEIARLNGGENVTAITLSSAAEQLAAAEEYKARMAAG